MYKNVTKVTKLICILLLHFCKVKLQTKKKGKALRPTLDILSHVCK